MPTCRVIDLSHHNTIPESLEAAKRSGVLGVIHKCTENVNNVDGDVDARHFLAKEEGMLWGLYHFLRPGSMEKQVDWFLENAQKKGVIDRETLVCLDHEDPKVSLTEALEFLKLLEKKSGRSPVLYSGHVLKDQGGAEKLPELLNYRLWLSQYTKSGAAPTLPKGYPNYWLWQYTDNNPKTAGIVKESIPGINDPVDCNQYVTPSGIGLANDWALYKQRPPIVGQVDNGPVVRVSITAPKGVKVEVETVES